jgi:quercetin dioxygenase-like cupin family protein
MPSVLRLPLSFDAAGLALDVAQVPAEAWRPHFHQEDYRGAWTGVALRSAGGSADEIRPNQRGGGEYQATPLLERSPHLAAALAELRCPLLAVRLLSLAPGAEILEHRDYKMGFDDGEVRLHVPITTAPEVEFTVAGELVSLRAGECWYLNVNRLHRAANRSSVPRVHLVIDCQVDDWLTALFQAAAGRG